MLDLDPTTFRKMLDAARNDARARRDWAWANAIERAQRYLKAGTTTITLLDADTYALTSPQSGATYHVNGTCQREDGSPCPAFADSRPCWHLAAKTLVAHTLAHAAQPEEATEDAPPPSPLLIPLQVGTMIVDYAESDSEATRWFREHEVYFLGLDVE